MCVDGVGRIRGVRGAAIGMQDVDEVAGAHGSWRGCEQHRSEPAPLTAAQPHRSITDRQCDPPEQSALEPAGFPGHGDSVPGVTWHVSGMSGSGVDTH